MPGATNAMEPRPDHGENSYKGSDKLKGLKAVITGADSGIGRAVAIAFAREGADVLIAYLKEDQDAKETGRLVEDAGRKAVLVAGDISSAEHCRAIIDRCVKELGGIDILVNNAAHQASFKSIEDITDHEWEHTFKVNIHAPASSAPSQSQDQGRQPSSRPRCSVRAYQQASHRPSNRGQPVISVDTKKKELIGAPYGFPAQPTISRPATTFILL